MNLMELMSIMYYCKSHYPVAAHKHYEIYIHGYENGYAIISQIYGDGRVLFTKARITSSKFMIIRLKDERGFMRTVALSKDEFVSINPYRYVKIREIEFVYR